MLSAPLDGTVQERERRLPLRAGGVRPHARRQAARHHPATKAPAAVVVHSSGKKAYTRCALRVRQRPTSAKIPQARHDTSATSASETAWPSTPRTRIRRACRACQASFAPAASSSSWTGTSGVGLGGVEGVGRGDDRHTPGRRHELRDQWDEELGAFQIVGEGYWATAGKMMLAGPSKAGKSFALIRLAAAIIPGATRWMRCAASKATCSTSTSAQA